MPHHTYYKVHIADGFRDDCEQLVHKCTQLETLNFHTFTNLWKEMNFYCIYQSRQSGAEIAELSEEVVYVAKQFFLANTSNFKETKAGLYLVYALLTQQPYPNFAWLRVTPDDVCAIKCIENIARAEKQYDVLYILGTVLIKHTQYHATERERGFDCTLRKYMEGCTSLDKHGLRPKGVFYQQTDELDMIKELGVIARRYTQARNTVAEMYKFGPGLKYINEKLPEDMHNSLKNVMNGFDDAEPEPSEHYDTVQSIKQKAMVTTVNPIAHLTSAEDRKVKRSPQKKSDIKSKAGKIKTCSPTKTVTSSPLKRKIVSSEGKPKRPKNFFTQLQQSEAELNLDAFDKEIVNSSEDSEISDEDMSVIYDDDDDTDDNDDDDGDDDGGDEELNIENLKHKDTLPGIVHSNVGEEYCEIEILDYAKNDKIPVKKAISNMLQASSSTSKEPSDLNKTKGKIRNSKQSLKGKKSKDTPKKDTKTTTKKRPKVRLKKGEKNATSQMPEIN